MSLVVLPVGARAREGNLFLLTVTQQLIVYELATVISIKTEEGKWKALPDSMNCSADIGLASAQQCHAFRPSCGNIRQNKGVEKRTLGSISTVRDQIGFHESGCEFVPVGKHSNCNLVLQEFPWPGRRNRPAFR